MGELIGVVDSDSQSRQPIRQSNLATSQSPNPITQLPEYPITRFRPAAAVLVALLLVPLQAQTARPITIQVTETTGIRRNEYPTTAHVQMTRGTLANADHVRLRANNADVPAQFAVGSKWDDGSVRMLDVDFNVSILPGESRSFQLEFGPDVTPGPIARGLQVTEAPDAIQIGNVKFGRTASPLIVSASYRGEYIGTGANGLTIIDAAGAKHDLANARDVKVELLKRGPLVAVVQYTGRVAIDASYEVPFAITCEMPSSKSWVRTSASVTDSGKRIKGLTLSTPITLGDKPWLWDFGSPNGTYGSMRTAADISLLTQIVGPNGANSWTVQTAAQGTLGPYESSTGARGTIVAGWGHLYDATKAVAFGIEKFATEPGTYTISLYGEGLAVFGVTPAQSRVDHQLTVYQHFVSTPIPIGAVTSPTAMLNPLVVAVKP